MQHRVNKALIAVPTYPGHSFCRPELVNFLRYQDSDVAILWNGRDPWGFEGFNVIEFEDNKPLDPQLGSTLAVKQSILVDKLNYARDMVLKNGYTHLFHLESDVIPPKDVINKFLEHGKDLVTGIYFIRGRQECMVDVKENEFVKYQAKKIGMKDFDTTYYVRDGVVPAIFGAQRISIGGMEPPLLGTRIWMIEDWIDKRLQGHKLYPVMASGIGCILIAREVLEKVRFEEADKDELSDQKFCEAARMVGHELFVDLDMICQHHSVDTGTDVALLHQYEQRTKRSEKLKDKCV